MTTRDPKLESAAIRGCKLRKSFNETVALDDVTFSAQPGEIVAIVGASGSGKSTLLLSLAGILRPDSGEVWFRDQRVDLLSEAARSKLRRTAFGILFQFSQLIAEMTAVENVALPLLLAGQRRNEAMHLAKSWLERVGVAEVASARPHHMSGGQAQRVALARAMVTRPDVLFADEPTGSLDSAASTLVLEQLTRLARDAGTTVLLVTHDAEVAAYADRKVRVQDGRVSQEPALVSGRIQ